MCAVEYCLALRQKQILSFVIIWVSLQDIILHKISQAQEDKVLLGLVYMWTLNTYNSYKKETTSIFQGCGRRGWEDVGQRELGHF